MPSELTDEERARLRRMMAEADKNRVPEADDDSELEDLELFQRCADCGMGWLDDGSEACPVCGSANISSHFESLDDEEL